MYIGAERHHKITDLFADAVLLGALKIHGDGRGGGLGADGSGIAGDLISDEDKGILPGHCPRYKKLDENVCQVHDDHHQENLPENAEDGKGLAGIGHVGEGTADIQGQQWDDNGLEHLVNNGGEILYGHIQSVADSLSPHPGQAKAQDKGQNYGGQSIKQWGNGY